VILILPCLLTSSLFLGPAPGLQKGGSTPEAPSKVEVILFQVNVGEAFDSFLENAYLVVDQASQTALLIDPGAPDSPIDDYLAQHRLKLRAILNTHGHSDHVGGNEYYARKFDVKVYAHRLDQPLILTEPSLMVFLDRAGPMKLGGFEVRLLPVPGHTPGSLCYLIEGLLFSGDTLFHGSIGLGWGTTQAEREGSLRREIEGIKRKLLPLPSDTRVYPGHEGGTTIGAERAHNPFLNPGGSHSEMSKNKTPGDR